jgi:hypothetical protein
LGSLVVVGNTDTTDSLVDGGTVEKKSQRIICRRSIDEAIDA